MIHDSRSYFVSLFTNTERAKQFKEKKKDRHDYNSINEICLVVDLYKDCKNKVGNFFLYDESHVKKIREQISLNGLKFL